VPSILLFDFIIGQVPSILLFFDFDCFSLRAARVMYIIILID